MKRISALTAVWLLLTSNATLAQNQHSMGSPELTVTLAVVCLAAFALCLVLYIGRIRLKRQLIEKDHIIDTNEKRQTQFFHAIGQSLKSPLTLVLGPLEAIDAEQSKHHILSQLELVQRNGYQLLKIAEQLIELAHLQNSESSTPEYCNLQRILSAVVEGFQPLLSGNSVTLKTTPVADLSIGLAPHALELLLTKLLSDALINAEPQSNLSLSVSHNEHSPTATLQFVTPVPNAAMSAAKDKIHLNRLMIAELVRLNGSDITRTNTDDNRQITQITLPVRTDPQTDITPEPLCMASSLELKTYNAGQSAPLHTPIDILEGSDEPVILLIDDNKDMLKLLQGILSSSYRCMMANNGHSGINKAKEYLPDLVICDVLMPQIDGFEVLETIKSDPLTCHIPVMLLTAKGDVKSRIRGWESNADEYLKKPFNVDELLSRVDSLLTIRQLLQTRYQQQFSRIDHEQTTAAQTSQEPNLDGVNARFIGALNQAMEKYYGDERFDVGQLASELGMSNRQLHRKTKSVLFLTPKESIRHFRLKKAAELLRQGEAAGEVAFKVGFSSHSYFSQCFKAHFNCSPSAYSD